MADPDQLLLEKMAAMENRAQMWQADLDQELQRLNSEVTEHLEKASSEPSMKHLKMRKEMQEMREFLVETLKHLKKSGEKSTLSKVKDPVPTSSSSSTRLLAKEKELQEREESLQAKEKSLKEKEQRVQREMKALKEKEMSFSLSQTGMSGAVLEKERELLDFKDRQLSDREQALQREKQSQQDREDSFQAREKLLLERELALHAEKKLHQEREQFIQSKERQQQDREDNLQAQKKLQQEREESLEALERQLQAPKVPVPTPTPAAAAPRRSKATSVPKTPPNLPSPATPPAPKAAPKRQPRSKTSQPPEVKDRSSRSRERVEVAEEPHPKTKRRKTSVYLTFEELRWEWMQSELPRATRTTRPGPSSPKVDTDLMQSELPRVAEEKKQPLEPLASSPKIAPKVDMPWDTDLMVELDEVEPLASPSAVDAESEVVVPVVHVDESYDVDGLDEEDLFGPEEASYMPPKSPMLKPQPPSQPSKLPEASGAKKKKDWYQRHYPGQVAPREPRTGAMPGHPARVSTAPSKLGPKTTQTTKPSASKADSWAYEPLKLQDEVESQGLALPDPLLSELPSIDDILPML